MNGSSNSVFRVRVEGPGRCGTCSWHVETQGHNPECTGGVIHPPPETPKQFAARLFARGENPNRVPWEREMRAEYRRLKMLATPVQTAPQQRRKGSAVGALCGAAKFLASRREGERNHVLNWAAHTMRKHVDSGELTIGEVQDALYNACVANGHAIDDGDRQVFGGIASGLGVSRDMLP